MRHRCSWFLIALLAIARAGGAEPFNQETAAWVPITNALQHVLGLTNVVRNADGLVLSNSLHALHLYAGRRNVMLDDVSVWLHLPPRDASTNDLRDITRADFETVLYPVLSATSKPPAHLRIIIDAGHGGDDHGACSTSPAPAVLEKDVALDIARQVSRRLKDAGHEVWLTRSTDTFVTLPDRPRIAESHKAQVFVSIHVNSSLTNPQACGAETYVLPSPGFVGTAEHVHTVLEPCAGNREDSRNALLGFALQHRCAPLTSMDRGLKRARYLVLRDAPCPAALIECGFLSNSNDAAHLAQAGYRTELAEHIAAGIQDYARLSPRTPVSVPLSPPPAIEQPATNPAALVASTRPPVAEPAGK